MNLLIGAGVVFVLIMAGAAVAAKRIRANNEETREERRVRTIASTPLLSEMTGSSTSDPRGKEAPGGLSGGRRRRQALVIAEVAYDAVDRPNGASSDDVDLLARRAHPATEPPFEPLIEPPTP